MPSQQVYTPEHKPQAKEGILATINEELQTESLLLLIYNASPRTRGGERLLRSIDDDLHPDRSSKPYPQR
jgi:hypothetical protein